MKKQLQLVRALQDKKNRQAEKKYIVEGIRSVEELLKEPVKAVEIFYTLQLTEPNRGRTLLQKIEKMGLPATLVSEKEMAYISDTQTPAGVLAVLGIQDRSIEDFLLLDNPFLLILSEVQDPGNLGTLIRTAEAAGVQGIVISHNTVDPYNPKVVRATMGSILRVPIVRVEKISELVEELAAYGIRAIAADSQAKKNYFDADWHLPLAIVLGGEAEGLSAEIINKAAEVVKIPQNKKVESLNVAIAGSILMYQVVEKGR